MTNIDDRPNNARMVDYILGGSHHFAIDRKAADAVLPIFPDGPELVRAQRRFLQRAVTWMAEERGIRRFLDFGSGLPSAGNTHEVATETHPDAQVVYTDIDPLTASYSQELLRDLPNVHFIQADVRAIDALLRQPQISALRAEGQPVGVVMVGIAMYMPPDTLGRQLAALHSWAPAGSALALVLMGPLATDHPGMQLYRRQGFAYYTQTEDEIRTLLGGWQLAAEGVVAGLGWRHPPDSRFSSSDINWSMVATR